MLSRSSLPLSLLLVAMVSVGGRGVWAASLPSGSRVKLTSDRPPPPPPSAEMLRALHYIQSLSQRGPPITPDNQQWEEEGEGQGEEGAEQWLQAVLETLQETQREGGRLDTLKTHPQSPSPALMSVNRRRHRKHPLEEAELGQGGWGNSLKRTNENAQDELYTPQKLATLQSVFEELQKITTSKSKRENKWESDYEEEGDGDEDGEEEEDAERGRKMPLEDWEPLDEDEERDREEDEEGETDWGRLSRENDHDDLREEDDYDDLLIKRSSQWDGVGRQGAGQADDLGSLVSYFLLDQRRRAAQEEKEEEEEEEEGGRGAAAVASLSLLQLLRISEPLGLSLDQLLDLLKASSNPLAQQAPQRTPQPLSKPTRTPARLQAPPQTTYEFSKPARTPAHVQAPLQTPLELKLQTGTAPGADARSRARTLTGLRTHTQENLLSSPHARPLEAPGDAMATAEILHLLDLPVLSPPQRLPVERQWQRPRAPPVPRDSQDPLFSQRSTDPLEDPMGHDPAVVPDDDGGDSAPLERLLLEEEGPEERGLPPQSEGADEEDRLALRVLTRALEDYYLDQPDPETDTLPSAMETRQSEPEEKTDRDDDNDQMLQRILGFFTPEQQDSSEMAHFS